MSPPARQPRKGSSHCRAAKPWPLQCPLPLCPAPPEGAWEALHPHSPSLEWWKGTESMCLAEIGFGVTFLGEAKEPQSREQPLSEGSNTAGPSHNLQSSKSVLGPSSLLGPVFPPLLIRGDLCKHLLTRASSSTSNLAGFST